MDDFGKENPLSDWVIQKYVTRAETDKYRLRIGVNCIGRHSASDLRIDSPLVSRHHAEILVLENGRSSVELRDLNSINGTYIDNNLYRACTKKLAENMVIGFGAEYDEDDIEEIPIYTLKYDPLRSTRICGSPVAEFIISDEEDHIDMKPIIPVQPAQTSRIASILNIFGDADEAILDGLQRINPDVCAAVKKTTNAELVILSSDDEEICYKGKLIQTVENYNSNDAANNSPDKIISNQNDNNEAKSDDESENGSAEENQLIYSQALINEMKSEMVDEIDDESDNISVEGRRSLISTKRSISPQIISLIDDDDEEDDDVNANNDDFDEDLEEKVSNWTSLLFSSQIYPKMNCSQTLVSDSSFNNDSTTDGPQINSHKDKYNSMSENTIIENLFQPLEHKLDTEKRTALENRASPEKRVSTEKRRSADELDSPVVKKKKRKAMQIIDESDEESSHSKQSDQIEKKSMNKTKETHLDKPAQVTSEIKKRIHKPPKPVQREVKVIETPPNLKFRKRNGIIEKKRTQKRDKNLQEIRKERLKRISHKTDENTSKNIRSKNDENKTKNATTKVKNTIHNRGAFLCEMDEASTSSANANLKSSHAENPYAKECGTDMNTHVENPYTKDCVNEIKKVIRKNAARARERSAPKKLRFADAERRFDEQQKIAEKTSSINSKLCPTVSTETAEASSTSKADVEYEELDVIIPVPATDLINDQEKPKKTVRFKDEPTIYYFESDYTFTRKVDRKDVCHRLSYRHRRSLMRRTFQNVDRTDDIISIILSHSNEWLSKNSITGSTDITLQEDLIPIPAAFESFEHYKRILFPLMKLEYMSTLQREMQLNTNEKSLVSELQDTIVNKERVLLVTKCSNNELKKMQGKKCDLVLLEVGESKIKVFAYMVSRKSSGVPADRFNMNIYVEVMSNSIAPDYLRKTKSIIIKPVMDNLQVTIGAYNAIYQLEATPLCEQLLNPALLINASGMIQIDLDDEIAPEVNNNKPNVEQLNGIRQIYKKICFNKTDTTPSVSLVQGPPGTGKSVVVVNLALQIIYGLEKKFRDKKILICAQSNCAIDSVAAKLLEARGRIKEKKNRFTLARFGIFEKMTPKVHPVSLNNVLEFERVKKISQTLYPQFANVPIWKNHLRKLENELKALRIQAKNDVEVIPSMEAKKREIDNLHSVYNRILSADEEQHICKNYLWQSNIICTTLSSCVKLYHWIDYFDICIIDEATQCTEPWTLLPLKFRISSLVLVGDSQQLPATVLSKKAADYGLSRSLLTRIENSIKDSTHCSNKKENDVIFSLRVQYRMHPEICKFPNSFFYKNMLVNAENTFKNVTPLMPYSILNLEYAQSRSSGQGKITNQLEADFVVELLKALNEYISAERHSYGVITPYAHQRKILADALHSARLPHVTVNTIDSYQGIEKDVIVISNARTNGVGFLGNPQRLNVAITRPRMCLILCGNFRNLQSVPAWRCLLKDAQQRHIYYEIGALDINDVKSKVINRILAKK